MWAGRLLSRAVVMGHEIDLEGHRLRFVPSPRRYHRDLPFRRMPGLVGMRPSGAAERARAATAGPYSRSMVASLMDHAERPSAATGLIRGVSGYHPAAENAVTAILAGRFLRPRPFRGLRGRMRTVFGCSPTSPIEPLASMAAPNAQRGERGAGGLLPAFSRSDGLPFVLP